MTRKGILLSQASQKKLKKTNKHITNQSTGPDQSLRGSPGAVISGVMFNKIKNVVYNNKITTIQFLIPFIVYLLVSFIPSRFGSLSLYDYISSFIIFLLPNYFIFTIPHVGWLALVKLFRMSKIYFHAGLFGANLSLLIVFVIILINFKIATGLKWFLYFQLAPILILSSVVITKIYILFTKKT